jgi:FdhE protein
VTTSLSHGRAVWERRLDRAAQLAERNPWANEVLTFYSRILKFQRKVYEKAQFDGSASLGGEAGLQGAINFDAAAESIPELIAVVQKNGPSKLAEQARLLLDSSRGQLREMLERCLAGSFLPGDGSSFFARVALQPQAERLSHAVEFSAQRAAGNKCPICESDPQVAVIRPEGDGGKRSLICSFCQWEWEFRRILCPACGEVNHEKLPRYTAEGIAVVRVEACDTCKSYLKSVDLTVNGLAVPEVDEIATAPLDLWAVEHGYRKTALNIMGF